MDEGVIFFARLALLLAGVAACVGFLVVIVSGVTWSVRKLKELQRL